MGPSSSIILESGQVGTVAIKLPMAVPVDDEGVGDQSGNEEAPTLARPH